MSVSVRAARLRLAWPAALFWLLPLFYWLVYGPYGLSDQDDGFILGLSWRIYNGEVPHRDFIYVRPPGSPLFHTITLLLIPGNFQIIFERLLFYFMNAAASLWVVRAVGRFFNWSENLCLNAYLLAAAGFVIGVHSFPPMPWHTTDAVFFSALGLYLITWPAAPTAAFFGAGAMLCAALCKQPFYVMPFVGLIVSLALRDRRKIFAFVFSSGLFGALFLGWLGVTGAFRSFVRQTFFATGGGGLRAAGLDNYASWKFYMLPVALVLLLIVRNKDRARNGVTAAATTVALTVVLAFGPLLDAYRAHVQHRYVAPDFFPQLLFVTAAVLLVWQTIQQRVELRFHIVCAAALAIPWCAGISLGYTTPSFGAAATISVLLVGAAPLLSGAAAQYVVLFALLAGLMGYAVVYQYPYNSAPRAELTYKVSTLNARLTGVRTDQKQYERYREFKDLTEKYARPFKVLPSMTSANYITRTRSPTIIDWAMDIETAARQVDVLRGLEKANAVVLIEKEPKGRLKGDGWYGSTVAETIIRTWKLAERGNFFDVYIRR